METNICPNCGQNLEQEVDTCPHCGFSQKEEIVPSQLIESETKEQSLKRPHFSIKGLLVGVMFIFAVLAVIFFYKAHYVKTVYYNSEYVSSLNKNAYVGGDAYNYIINGTYFTGYSATASSCMLCAVICGVGAATITKERDEVQK